MLFKSTELYDSESEIVFGETRLQQRRTDDVAETRFHFLPARRYASAGYRDRNVSVRLSVCASVRHAPVLCQNEES